MSQGQIQDVAETVAIATVAPRVAGLVTGTTVLTLDGEKPLETLKTGDRIITRDGGARVLRDVRTTQGIFSTVKIMAGSLGHTRAQNDLIVGPDTLVHIRDWRAKALFGADVATIKAKHLIDGEFVSSQDAALLKIHELVFDRRHILYADGLEVASATI